MLNYNYLSKFLLYLKMDDILIFIFVQTVSDS